MITANNLPRVTASAIEARLRRWHESDDRSNRVIALRGAPEWDGGLLEHRGDSVPVRTARTVLGVLDALASHTGRGPLVLITDLGDDDLGDSIRSRLHGHEVRTVDHWDTVLTLAGATRVEPALAGGHAWLAEAAAGLGPQLWDGWKKTTELRRDTLLSRVAAHRLERAPSAGVDAAALIEFFARRRWDETWGSLPEAEREGFTDYLASPGVIGPTAPIILGLARAGQKVVSIGLAARELYADDDPPEGPVRGARDRFEGRFFFDFERAPTPGEIRLFAEQAHGVVQRWRGDGEADRAEAAELAAVGLLDGLKVPELAAESTWLGTGRDAAAVQFAAAARESAEAIARAESGPGLRDAKRRKAVARAMEEVEGVYRHLASHERTRPEDLEAPRAALRLLRWLARPEPDIDSIASGLRWQIDTGGWVDRACFVLRNKDTTYGEAVCSLVAERRRSADRRFARHLAAWGGKKAANSGLLRIEDVLGDVAEPLAKASAPPLLLVVDGMSAADAASLAEGIAGGDAETRDWTEVVPEGAERRAVALAAVPTETRNSRTSLLSGELATGGQGEEDRGFKRFWGRYNRHNSVVLHKDDLRGTAGRGLPEAAREAIADTRRVVAAVLNQIDDALDADERRAEPEWRFDKLDLAAALLAEAARAARPVVLCSDHGNIRDIGGKKHPGGEGNARWRPGSDAAEGEVALSGGRLSVPGPICAAVDADVRYGSRRAGYHGGASLAEAAVPVLVFVPAAAKEPKGWIGIGRGGGQPPWWTSPIAATAPAAPARAEAPKRDDTLFDRSAARTGAQVTASRRYEARLRIIGGKLPSPERVAEVIDRIEAAGGRIALSALAEQLGTTLVQRFARGELTQVKRLLNEPGAEVLTITDGGRTVEVNRRLLHTQFLGGR